MAILIVVNKTLDFPVTIPGVEIITAKTYLSEPRYTELKAVRIFNLCRSFAYQSTGYYISLLAAARGHKVFPDITTIQDTKTYSIIKLRSEEISDLIQKTLTGIKDKEYEFNIYFGRTINPSLQPLASQIFGQFPAPLLTVYFTRRGDHWQLQDVDPISPKELPKVDLENLSASAQAFFNKRRLPARKQELSGYEMAILVNPEEKEPPSNKLAIKKFIKAAETLGMGVWTIGRNDFNHLGEYDALFIRETTHVNHYTYRFARRAAVEGLVVIDDPESILRCSNKVYLAELMERNGIPTPKTLVVHKDNTDQILPALGLPVILKLPDSCFSMGVKKADNEKELAEFTKHMLDKSDLIIAQKFQPTPFDWRIGILDRKPLFACRYYMAGNHWQIMNWKETGENRYGKHTTIPVEEAPEAIVQVALKAANLIGDGFYGVDMKEIDGKPYLVEINDNPSIDAGVEDEFLQDQLYLKVMEVFLQRIQRKKAGCSKNTDSFQMQEAAIRDSL